MSTSAASTRTATLERTPAGIVLIRILPHVRQQIRDAEENVMTGVRLADGRRSPLLVDIRNAVRLDAEVRHYYSGATLSDNFTALGLLVPVGAFGRMFGNVYLRVASPQIPSRLFDDEAEALVWAGGHR